MSLHRRRTHPVPVDGCFACKVGTVVISPAAMATRIESDRDYAYQQSFAGEWERGDRDAYRRLRREGHQPPTIAGSAHLERHATTDFEIASGKVYRDKRGLGDALAFAEDHGLASTQPQTTPLTGGLA